MLCSPFGLPHCSSPGKPSDLSTALPELSSAAHQFERHRNHIMGSVDVCQTPVLFAAGPAVRGGPREPKQRGTSAGSSVASLVEAIRSGDDGRWCERYSQSQEIQEPVLSRALCLDHAQPLEVSRHGRCLAGKRELCHHQQAHEDVFPSVCPLVSASAFLTVDFIHGSRVVLFAVICQCGLNQRLCRGRFV